VAAPVAVVAQVDVVVAGLVPVVVRPEAVVDAGPVDRAALRAVPVGIVVVDPAAKAAAPVAETVAVAVAMVGRVRIVSRAISSRT